MTKLKTFISLALMLLCVFCTSCKVAYIDVTMVKKKLAAATTSTSPTNETSTINLPKVIDLVVVGDANSTSPTTSTIDLTWSHSGDTPSGYIIAYTEGATAAPVDCTSGTVIPKASITGEQHTISALNYSSTYHLRVCPVDQEGETNEDGAYEIDMTLDNIGAWSSASITTETNPCGNCSGSVFGSLISFVGKFNGDNFEDVLFRNSDMSNVNYKVMSGVDNSKILTINSNYPQMKFLGYDANGDGIKDFIGANSSSNAVTIYSGATGNSLFSLSPQSPADTSLFGENFESISDITSDGKKEIWVSGKNTTTNVKFIAIYNGANGSFISQFDSEAANNDFKILSINDFDGDTLDDYAIIDGKKVKIYSALGALIKDFDEILSTNSSYNSLHILKDINNDGKSELVINDYNDARLIFYDNNSTDPLFNVKYASTTSALIVNSIQDLDGDGYSDILVSRVKYASFAYSGDLIFIHGKTGIIKKQFYQSGTSYHVSNTVGDYNNDGNYEIAIGYGTNSIFQAFSIRTIDPSLF